MSIVKKKINIVYLNCRESNGLILSEFMHDMVNMNFFKRGELPTIDVLRNAEIIISDYFLEEYLTETPKLKYFFFPYTGIPAQLSNVLVRKKGLIVSNAHYNAASVAEHVFSLILALARKTVKLDGFMRRREVPYEQVRHEHIYSLGGKTIGIIGYGHIGRRVERIAKAFGMTCLLYRKHRVAADNTFFAADDAKKENLHQILARSDFVVLCLPLTKETNALIGDEEFACMKKTAFIINVSRGRVVDELALYSALKRKKITGAGIDTWYNYDQFIANTKRPYNRRFDTLDNVTMSPHVAFRSDSLSKLRVKAIMDYLDSIINKKKIQNKVHLERGY